MKLEGVHHITAITADAPRNVEFYTGLLGLRMVKRTVNQDDPTVYHLFYGDEDGSPGMDLTFFEYPGAAPGRAGDGMVHRILWRVGSQETLGFWAERLAGADVSTRTGEDGLVFADPEGLEHELVVSDAPDPPLRADSPEIPAEHALLGFEGARAYASDPSRSEAFLEGRSDSTATARAGGRSAGPTVAAPGSTTLPLRGRRSRAPAAFTTSPSPRRWTSRRRGGAGRSRPAPARPP